MYPKITQATYKCEIHDHIHKQNSQANHTKYNEDRYYLTKLDAEMGNLRDFLEKTNFELTYKQKLKFLVVILL